MTEAKIQLSRQSGQKLNVSNTSWKGTIATKLAGSGRFAIAGVDSIVKPSFSRIDALNNSVPTSAASESCLADSAVTGGGHEAFSLAWKDLLSIMRTSRLDSLRPFNGNVCFRKPAYQLA